MSNPPVTITEAPDGIPATVLGRLATADLATIMFVPSPNGVGRAETAADVLQALGKRLDVTGKPRNSTEQAELVPIWVTAHRTRLIVAAPCQRASDNDLQSLVEMTSATPAQLLLACDHGFATALTRRLAHHDPVTVPWPTVPDQHPSAGANDHDTQQASFDATVDLPTIEYWTFYATARRLLTPADFAPVDTLYRETASRLDQWLTTLDADNLTADLAHDSLRTLIEEQATYNAITVVTRAAQATFHRTGWFLDVDERELRNGLIRFPPAQTDPTVYDRLRAYFEPARAATVSLYLAGATPEAIRNTTIADLARWHHNPHEQVADIPVPDRATPYLRAAIFARAVDGARPDEPAFPGSHRRVLLDIRQASRDLGINVGDANLDDASTIGGRRVPKRVIKLERIT